MNSTARNNNQIAETWKRTEMSLAERAAVKHIPLGGIFELTPRCNLRCKMCYAKLDNHEMDKTGRERTAKEWISLAEEAIAAGTLNLLLTGGEPFIRSDFEDIYTALANMGFIITINTNATLMSPRLQKLFQKYPPTAINVTLYGASKDTYAKVCGNPEAFDQTIRGLELLSEVPTTLEVRTTFIKDNMNELDELRTIANRFTKRFAINTNIFKAIRGAHSDAENCRLEPEQIIELVDANKKYYKDHSLKNGKFIEDFMEKDQNAGTKEHDYNIKPEILPCLAAKSMFWITWDGKMLPCGTFSSPFTLPFEEGFKKAWDRLPGLFENIEKPKECLECEDGKDGCSNCPALLQAETGSFNKTSPYICGITKEIRKKLKEQEKTVDIKSVLC